jgi:hypothetical protein
MLAGDTAIVVLSLLDSAIVRPPAGAGVDKVIGKAAD